MEPRCNLKMGVLIMRGFVGSAQELELDPEGHVVLLQGFRKLM